MTGWTPTIARIHMELASPTCDRALVTDLLGTFTTRDAAYLLATATADAITAKLAWTNLTIPIRGRPGMTAWWILTMPDDATQILDELGTDGLAATCIALLGIWCDACDRAAETALAGLTIPETPYGASDAADGSGTERPSEAPLAPQEPLRATPDAPEPADGCREASA